MDVLPYIFISINGRIGFVPFVLLMKDKNFRKERMIDQPLDLENIVGEILCFEFRYDFVFDSQSANTFTEAI